MTYKNPNYSKDYYIKNKEHIRELEKERRKNYTPEQLIRYKETQKRYQIKNKDKIIRRHKKYNDEHKEQFKKYNKKNEVHIKEHRKEYYAKNRDKILAWKKEYRLKNIKHIKEDGLKRKYGLSLDEYTKLLNEQENKCAICGKHQSEFKRQFAVDHNHNTGKIRKLLCGNCNAMLGNAKDDIDILQKAIEYLKNNV